MDHVSVDGQSVQVGAKTYALANIALATAEKSANTWTGVGMVLMGGVPLAVLLVTGNTNALCLGVFGALVAIGILVAAFGGSAWWVYIETTQGKRKRIWSAPEARAWALAEEINEALARGSPRVVE